MSDEPDWQPDWMGAATDALRDVGLDDAAVALARLPGVEDRLEFAVRMLEEITRQVRVVGSSLDVGGPGLVEGVLLLIAEHRGETTERALARLSPKRPSGFGP